AIVTCDFSCVTLNENVTSTSTWNCPVGGVFDVEGFLGGHSGPSVLSALGHQGVDHPLLPLHLLHLGDHNI
ncbi:hypothetical protein QHH03_32150, partial [Aphanizomenon sp. 202]|nr:hypothetical protein [Aphanizomenon sp. 202]